jgi:hypothetical protein
MTACYSYNNMLPGVQYTELWYRDGLLVSQDTHIWGEVPGEGTGGLGIAQWTPPPEMWLPGEYEVQIFIGLEWKVVGRFRVSGDLPTPTLSATPSATIAPTETNTLTTTPTASRTPSPSTTP